MCSYQPVLAAKTKVTCERAKRKFASTMAKFQLSCSESVGKWRGGASVRRPFSARETVTTAVMMGYSEWEQRIDNRQLCAAMAGTVGVADS
jgi:N-methylhydantoinase B/oxoprolinase/acetone carboxylase alpha subunit